MNQEVEMDPGEKGLFERCKEVGLSESQTELARDLMGWNNHRTGGMPVSRLRILPQMRMFTEYRDASAEERKEWEDKAKELADLVRHLLGEELLSSGNLIQFLRGKKYIPEMIAWIVAQLDLIEQYPELESSIGKLCYHSPESMVSIVMPTLGGLLRDAKAAAQ